MENDIVYLKKEKRVLFLTKDLNLIKEQLYNGLNLQMKDLSSKDLLDDINTDIMTPAWVCFHYDPKEIAKRAYAGLMLNNERVFNDNALIEGNFQAIVSGKNKGCGSSRETAAQCEKFSGIELVFAQSFAPIHARNNINLGQVMGSYELLMRLQNGEKIPLKEILEHYDNFSKKIIIHGGLFKFLETVSEEKFSIQNKTSKPMNMAQKIIAKKLVLGSLDDLFNNEAIIAKVDKGYSHEFTSAQVHKFLQDEYGANYKIKNAHNFAAFEDHLVYTDEVKRYMIFMPLIKTLREKQKEFIKKNNLNDYSATNGISPGICHEVARQDFILPADFIQATDSHTCMGGALNAFAYGIGATEYASILATGLSIVKIPKSINFRLTGRLKKNCTAKDIMLFILANYAKKGLTLDKIMEFTGDGLINLSIDERATLCNMATECGAKTGICAPDEKLVSWLLENRPNLDKKELEKMLSFPDDGCDYEESIEISLNTIKPMIAHPGNPDLGIPSDPTNGELVENLGDVKIDIAYGGSCTAGKYDDIKMYAQVVERELKKGNSIPASVQFYIQYGSHKVKEYSIKMGFHELFNKANIKIIEPGCGACIGCGPGVSESHQQVSISAINRNFQGRSGPGKLYLASPLTVAASAFAGKIVSFKNEV